MRLKRTPLLILFLGLSILLIQLSSAQEDSESAEDDESGSEEEDEESSKKDKDKKKDQQQAANANDANTQALVQLLQNSQQLPGAVPYIQDPYLFYRWPGFGHSEGIYARWPWWPQQELPKVQKDEKDKKKKKGEDEEQDDKDDSSEEDHHPPPRRYKKKHHGKKYHNTAVFSVGVGPPAKGAGKLTPWGVYHADVNSRSSVEDVAEGEVEEGLEELYNDLDGGESDEESSYETYIIPIKPQKKKNHGFLVYKDKKEPKKATVSYSSRWK